MKSRLQHLVQLTGNGLRPALLALALTGLTVSMAANAQETWRVDPQHSVARLYFGRGSQAFEIGVVRITGDVVFDSKDPANSTVRLSLQPADRFRADYAEISFTSKQSTMRSDGKLAVTGDLFVTRVNRSVTMEPTKPIMARCTVNPWPTLILVKSPWCSPIRNEARCTTKSCSFRARPLPAASTFHS